MVMIFEIEHDLWLNAIFQNQNLGKNLWQKNLAGRPKATSIWLSEWYQHPNNQPHTGICSYMYYLRKNNTEWTILIPTASLCEVRLFELAVIGTILSVMKNNTGTGKLGKLFSGRKASRRKWKSENETENPNTSYLAEL